MNDGHTFVRLRAPRASFGAIFRNEARLVWRQPAGGDRRYRGLDADLGRLR
jgi:hypothetical protein